MKILWLTNIPSPYRVKFFNELGKYCDLTVVFEKKYSSERDESWKKFDVNSFTAVFLKGKSIGVAEAFCPSVVRQLKRGYDHIVVTNYSDPTGILAIIWMKLFGVPYEIEGDGAFPGSSSGIKAAIKRFLLKDAKVCFSSAKLHDQYYYSYGVLEKNIIRYPFSSILEKDIIKTNITIEQKRDLKKQLNMQEENIILAVGQFIPRKGYDILLRAFKNLPVTYGLYIVGGKAPEEYYSIIKETNLTNIHFMEFMDSTDLKKYYQASDLFVHPTREDIWGLVVNEAMANGLPVITTDKCIAGLELIKQGENGYVVPTENATVLSRSIDKILSNIQLKNDMAKKSLETVSWYTIENMAKVHIDYWTTLEDKN